MDDKQIIARVKQGDIEIFATLVERHQKSLLNFIYSLTRDSALSEDLAQMVFLALFRSIEDFDEDEETPVSAWLFTAARNLTINTLKKESRLVYGYLAEDCYHDKSSDPELTVIAKEQHQLLKTCLAQLPQPFRSILAESLEGRTIKEIARKKALLPGTVKSRLFRARKKIIAQFKSEYTRSL